MKCKKIFALLLSLCMIASLFVAMPVSAVTKTVILAQAGSDFNAEEPNLKVTVKDNAATVATSYVNKDGKDVVKLEVSGVTANTGNNLLIGFQINDGDGNAVASFASGTTFDYDMNFMIETADASDPVDATGTQGLWIRGGVWDNSGNIPTNTGETIKYINEENGYAPNTWVNWEGKFTTTKDYADQGKTGGGVQRPYNFFLRPNLIGDCVIYIDSMHLSLTEEVEVVDQVVAYLPQGETTNNGTLNYTFEDGTFTVTVGELKNFSNGQNLSSNCFLRFIPAEPISKDSKFKVAFDLETSGLKNSQGNLYTEMDAGVRMFNNTTGNTNANTVCWLKHNVQTNNGVVAVEYINPDDHKSDGNVPNDDIASIGISLNVQNAIANSADDAYFKISNVRIEEVTEETPEDPEEPSVEPDDVPRVNVIEIEAIDASGLTMKGDSVTLTDNQTIGGKNGVVKAEGVSSAGTGILGVKLPDGFAFKEDDVLTYSVDIYPESEFNPYIYVRDHKDWNPMAIFFKETIATNEWTTITKTVTYDELVAASLASNSDNTFDVAGNFAVYLRPKQAASIYVDNFKVTVARALTGKPTLEATRDYVTLEDGVFTATTADLYELEASGAWSSQVRMRIIPEVPVSTSDKLKVSFDFEAAGILNSIGQPYSTMVVNLRLYDSVDGENQGNTIGYIKNAAVPANTGAPVTVEYYIEDMENGGGTSTATEIKSIGVQVDMHGACTRYGTEANDGYYTISNVKVENVEKEEHVHEYGDWVTDGEENHKKMCKCGDKITEAHVWDEGVVTLEPTTEAEGEKTYTCSVCGAEKTEVLDKIVIRANVVDIDVADASGLTMVGSNVTLTDNQTIGGKSGVVKVEGVKNANGNQIGVKLPDGFAFKADDVLTYSVDVYSESTIKPDIYVRDHKDWNPMAVFYNNAIATNTWTTITKTVTYDELVAADNTGALFTDAGDYAVYLRPRTDDDNDSGNDPTATIYLDNFKVTVARALTGKPTVEPTVAYVTETDGVYKVVTADVYENESSGAWSSQVRLRIIPEVPVSTSDKLKVSFDFDAVGILNSVGAPYETMTVNLRLYDSVDGTNQGATIGYIKNAAVPANTGAPVTVEYYIEDMENGGGTSTATEIKSIGVQVDMNGACIRYGTEANDGYYTISNIKVENVEKPEVHEHVYTEEITKAATCTEAGVKTFTCECGDSYTEEIEALGHTEVIDAAVAATCTETGLTEGKHCSVCGEVIVAQEVVAALGHSYGEWSYDDEENHKKECGACGDVVTEAHAWDEGVITLEPTVDTEGERTYTCTVCGETKTEAIEKLPAPTHTPGNVNGDTIVDIKDVIAIRQHLAGGYDVEILEAAANVNGDAIVDIKDVIAIRQHLAGGYGVELQ